MPDWRKPFNEIEIGKGRLVKDGGGVAILSLGHVGNFAVDACKQLITEELFPAHYDMRFAKPLDEELLHDVFKRFSKIITVEDGVLKGGFGSAVLEFMSDNGYNAEVKRLGIPDKFVEHGTQKELYRECGYDAQAIVENVRAIAHHSVKITYR